MFHKLFILDQINNFDMLNVNIESGLLKYLGKNFRAAALDSC